MANATYVSIPIVAPNLAAKRVTAYTDLLIFLQHLRDGTGGYSGDIVSIDFNVTGANVITLTVTQPIPTQQLPRYTALTRTV